MALYFRAMIKPRALLASLVLALGTLAAEAGERPIVVELFTSEGCSSCPPADALLAELAARPEVLALSFHVDYWDRLGWKDPFSSSVYTARQQEYSNRLHGEGVYTPQLVVDGRFGFVGSDGHQASSAIQKATRDSKIPISISNASRNGSHVTAHIEVPGIDQSFKGGRGTLFVAVADNRAESQVARGENAGRSLAHVGVTRVLKQVGTIDLGAATATDVTLAIQPGAGVNGARLVVFIQDVPTGRVVAVAAQKL